MPENLAYVLSQMDVDSYFDHTIFEITIGNGDIGNTRFYRVPGGKWKWVLYDTEAGFLNLNTKPLELYTLSIGVNNGYFQHAPLVALLRVPAMRDKFFTRFAEILETVFLRENIEAVIDKWAAALEPVLPRHLARWGRLTMQSWRNNVSAIRYNGRTRAVRMPGYVKRAFGLTNAEYERYFAKAEQTLREHNKKKR